MIAYSAADIFVSLTRMETQGLVLQESAACGIPMVAFNVGGVPDIVHDGVTGYLAQPESAEDLCKGMVALLKDARLRMQMSHNARNLILRDFTLKTQVQRYVELYEDCLRRRNRRVA